MLCFWLRVCGGGNEGANGPLRSYARRPRGGGCGAQSGKHRIAPAECLATTFGSGNREKTMHVWEASGRQRQLTEEVTDFVLSACDAKCDARNFRDLRIIFSLDTLR